jgi:ribosomal protein L7Ae-like RNA K-turn-binding protein
MVNPATGVAIEKRGKMRVDQRPKKPTKLKQAILEERSEAWNEEVRVHEGSEQNAASASTIDSAAPNLHFTGFKARSVVPKTERDLKVIAMKRLPKKVSLAPRSYVHELITEDLNKQVFDIISQLNVFHLRAKALAQKKPSKAKRGKRLVSGLREVSRAVLLSRAKFVVIAPNIEEGTSEGGLDATVMAIIEAARARAIPTIVALNRRRLGQTLGKTIRTSVIAVVNVDGCHEQYVKLLEYHEKLRLLSAIQYKLDIKSSLEKFGSRIDRMALVDSSNPQQVIEYLGNRGEHHENRKTEVIIDLSKLKGSNDRSISVRILTSPSNIGSLSWHLVDHPEEVCMLSQTYPYVLKVKKGKFIRDWHPTVGSFHLRVLLHSEFDGRGQTLDTLEVKLTITRSEQDLVQTQDDDSYGEEIVEPLAQLVDGASDESSCDSDGYSSLESDSEGEISISSSTTQRLDNDASSSLATVHLIPTPVESPTEVSSSTQYVILTPEELEAAQALIRREKRAQKRARLERRLLEEQAIAAQQHLQNTVNREKHARHFPGRPDLGGNERTHDFFSEDLEHLTSLLPATSSESWTLFIRIDVNRSLLTCIIDVKPTESLNGLIRLICSKAQLSPKNASLSFLGAKLSPSDSEIGTIEHLSSFSTLRVSLKKA